MRTGCALTDVIHPRVISPRKTLATAGSIGLLGMLLHAEQNRTSVTDGEQQLN